MRTNKPDYAADLSDHLWGCLGSAVNRRDAEQRLETALLDFGTACASPEDYVGMLEVIEGVREYIDQVYGE